MPRMRAGHSGGDPAAMRGRAGALVDGMHYMRGERAHEAKKEQRDPGMEPPGAAGQNITMR